MDKFQAYKEIKSRSLFNIIPEHYHQEILDGSSLVSLSTLDTKKLKNMDEALYVVCGGEIALYEKERKLKIKVKSVIKGRSLELDRFMLQVAESKYNWEIVDNLIAFEIPKTLLFNIFERNEIFYKYLERVLTSFELRKLKNDLRLFGFNEDEIQKTFYCLEDYSDSIGQINDAICIIRKSQATFYYFFDGHKKILGEFEDGDFFVWNKNRKLHYEISDHFSCWKLEVEKWVEYVEESKIRSFVQLVDPFKGKIISSKVASVASGHQEVLVNQNEDFENFCNDEYVDFKEYYETTDDIDQSGFIATYALIKSFKLKMNKEYLLSQLPIGIGGSTLYDIRKVFEKIGFKALMINLSPKQIKEVKWPIILKHKGRHIVIYENALDGYVVMDPLQGEIILTHQELETNSVHLCLIVKSSDLVNGQKYEKKLWGDYLDIVFQSKRLLGFIFLSSILVFGLNLVLPVVTQIIFDVVLTNKDLAMLTIVSSLAIVLLIISSILVFVRSYLLTFLTSIIDAKFSSTFFNILLGLDRKFYEKYSSGDIISRLNELKKIRKFFTAKTFKLIVDILSALIFIFVLGFYNIKLLICVIALMPLILIYLKFFTPKIVEALSLMYEFGAEAQSFLIEHFSSVETVKSYNMTYRARLKWQNKFNKVLAQRKKFELLNSFIGVGSDFFLQFIPLVVVIYAIYLHLENELTLGQVIASTSMVGFIIYPVINLMKFMDDFKQMGVSFDRINEVVTSAKEHLGGSFTDLDDNFKTVKFKKVSYKYGDEISPYVIKNVDMTFEIGKNYGLVGGSGVGKTTLAQLIVGSDRPINGEIRFDDFNLDSLNFDSVRKNVVYVSAEPQTFSGTIVENISLRTAESSLEKVIEAAKAADAHEFISSLPFGYMTKLGEGGEGLSLGQKQKISIARALYNRPKVLILDEATSILDAASERNIFQNLKEVMLGRTLIIVTHRLEILGQVDEVVVMHNGEIAEIGRHDDLILNQGRYYEMWKDIN